MDTNSLIGFGAIFLALALGGIMKGATGAGAPVIAIPVTAAFYDVETAVVVMMAPNLLTNLFQIWRFRAHNLTGPFTWRFAIAGAIGALIGTVLLAVVHGDALMLVMAASVIGYVVLRLLRPGFRLPLATANRFAAPVALTGGVLQGATGVSAPIAVTYLNAMALDRMAFIPTVSAFFAAMAFVQIPMQGALGIMTWTGAAVSLTALIPLVLFMPVGNWLGKRMSRTTFDRAILVLLVGLAAKLIFDAL